MVCRSCLIKKRTLSGTRKQKQEISSSLKFVNLTFMTKLHVSMLTHTCANPNVSTTSSFLPNYRICEPSARHGGNAEHKRALQGRACRVPETRSGTGPMRTQFSERHRRQADKGQGSPWHRKGQADGMSLPICWFTPRRASLARVGHSQARSWSPFPVIHSAFQTNL